MTTATTAPIKSRHQPHVTFGGVLKSEFIKLFTLRSTFWCMLIVVVLWVGIGLLIASFTGIHRAGIPTVVQTHAEQQATAAADATGGAAFGELVLSVLGVLVISGEYGTGMIRSTFAAVPTRLPALFAKAIALGVSSFVLALFTIYLTAAIIFPILATKKVHADWGNWKLHESLIGGAVFIAIISLIAFCIGAIIRVTAGGVAAAMGVVLVLPIVFEVIYGTTQATWAENVSTLLPTSAGKNLYTYVVTAPKAVSGVLTLDRTTGGLVLLAWFVVLFVVAAIMLKRRDA